MPGSLYNLGKAVILINGEDASIKLDATKVEMEIVEDVVARHFDEGSLAPTYDMLTRRSVVLRCEFTEDILISAGVSADPVKAKKVVDLIRVIRLKK